MCICFFDYLLNYVNFFFFTTKIIKCKRVKFKPAIFLCYEKIYVSTKFPPCPNSKKKKKK